MMKHSGKNRQAAAGGKSALNRVRRLHFKLLNAGRPRRLKSTAEIARLTRSRSKHVRSIFSDPDDSMQPERPAANRSIEYSLRFHSDPGSTVADDTLNNSSTALPARISAAGILHKIDATAARPVRTVGGQRRRKPSGKPMVSYERYIGRVLRSVYGGDTTTRLSRMARTALSDFVVEMFDMLAEQSAMMVRASKHHTLDVWDVQQALRIVLPPGLAWDANARGVQHWSEYRRSREGC